MQKISIYTTIIFITILIGLSACHSRKKVTQDTNSKVNRVDSLFQDLKDNEFQVDWMRFSFKASAETSQGNYNFSGQIRMRKDSVVWISISPALGIEMMRLKITTDSVFMINKLKRTYLRENSSFINTFLGTDLDFDMVQSLLLGNDFTYYSQEQFEIKETESDYVFSTISRRKLKDYIDTASIDNLLIQKMHLAKSNLKIISQDIKQVRNPNKKLSVDYLVFETVAEQLFPTSQDYTIRGVENLKLSLSFSKFRTGEKQSFPFKITSKYTRL